MKTKILLLHLFIVLGTSCHSQKLNNHEQYYDENEYFSLDVNFGKAIKNLLRESKKVALLKEKESFVKCNIVDDVYKKNLDFRIQNYNQTDEDLDEDFLNNIISKRKKNINIKKIYFINIFLSGEVFTHFNYLIIENFDSTVELFSSNKKNKTFANLKLIDFTDEFMLNLPYSYENKSPSLSGNLIISKVVASGTNNYIIESTIATEILHYQLQIVKNFYEVN